MKKRVLSFKYAWTGIGTLFSSQVNARIHLAAAILVLILGFLLNIELLEWSILLLTISIVMLAEGLNTALEFLCDAVHPEQHPLIKKSKDVAAGSVLITAIIAVVVGLIIFLPKIMDRLG